MSDTPTTPDGDKWDAGAEDLQRFTLELPDGRKVPYDSPEAVAYLDGKIKARQAGAGPAPPAEGG